MARETEHRPANGLFSRFRTWLRSHGERQETQRMSPRLIAETARDLNVTAQELVSARVINPNASRLMNERLEASGVDPAYVRAVEPAVYRDLERLCSRCRSAGRCEHDLKAGDAESGQRGYCPNAGTIDALAIGKPHDKQG